MSSSNRRSLIITLVLLALLLLALLLVRCSCARVKPASVPPPVAAVEAEKPSQSKEPKASASPAEILTAATLSFAPQATAGALFKVTWTGPDNTGDYVTIVAPDAPADRYENYTETRHGNPLELTAPIEPGHYEIRYVAVSSRTVLGRAPIEVLAALATITAPAEAVLGTGITIAWTGPDNKGDYITIVPQGTPDGQYRNYAETAKGSPLIVTAPVEPGECEVRYMTGQQARVLARRVIRITTPEVSITAPSEIIAGAVFQVAWTGPNNPNDYITIVPRGTPDGQYRNYLNTDKGPKLGITALIEPGEAELRYMTGQGARVLARRPITIQTASVSIEAPADAVAGSPVRIVWSGPNNQGDYVTIVRQTTPDGQYARYADTSKGSPLSVECPIDSGPAEIRYMSGQGAKVLARRGLQVNAADVSLRGPGAAQAGATIVVEWKGPDNPGDSLTVVAKSSKDGSSFQSVPTSLGSPAKIRVPTAVGLCEIRYMSGQGNRVLARSAIEILEPVK